jgi:formylglycine-generating enzyme
VSPELARPARADRRDATPASAATAQPVASCCAPERLGRAPAEGRSSRRPGATVRGGAHDDHDHDDDDGLVEIPAGTFTMGTDRGDGDPADGEGPAHEVRLSTYRIATTSVTNARFARFVEATGHRTGAEVLGDSFVFGGLLPDDFPPTRGVAAAPWWRLVEGADWCHPEGPGSSLAGRARHPVVHVSWDDARAYCRWTGARLPTEAEWERAARGGLEEQRFPWGDDREPAGHARMNVFQGDFPIHDPSADGWRGTNPVDAYSPNGFGLFDTTGNVWEWCADHFDPAYYRVSPLVDPRGPHRGSHRVMRGGSYLCHDSYCNRYRVDARSGTTPDSTTGNIGFRVAAAAADV